MSRWPAGSRFLPSRAVRSRCSFVSLVGAVSLFGSGIDPLCICLLQHAICDRPGVCTLCIVSASLSGSKMFITDLSLIVICIHIMVSLSLLLGTDAYAHIIGLSDGDLPVFVFISSTGP